MNDIESRLTQIETSHKLLAQDVHQIAKTLTKMEQSIEKINETMVKFLVIEEKVNNNSKRIDDLEDGHSKALWLILGGFVTGAIGFIFTLIK
jgi:DNA anti-recombination protein RmuC